jgi:Condensation domain
VDPRAIEDVFALAPTQLGMLFQVLANPGGALYVEQTVSAISGALDRGAFHAAWQLAVDRHASLRTAFAWEGLSRPVQVVHRQARIEMTVIDWRALAPAEQAARTEGFLAADRRRGFDLHRPPLTRLSLLQLADGLHTLVWTSYHLVLDAWCVSILLREVLGGYEECRGGQRIPRPAGPRYHDYVSWVHGQDLAAGEAFWRRALAGLTAPTPLPGLAPAAGAEPTGLEPLRLALAPRTAAALAALGRAQRLTLHAMIAGAWALVLAEWSGRDEVVFDTVVSGRPPQLPGAGGMVGLFINTLPLRVRLRPRLAATAWLREIQAWHLESQRFEHCPLGKIQAWSGLPAGQPLAESLLVLFNVVDLTAAASLRISFLRDVARSTFPLVLRVYPEPELVLEMLYDPHRLRRDAVAMRLALLAGVLEALAESPAEPVAALAAGLDRRSGAVHQQQASDRRAAAGARLRRFPLAGAAPAGKPGEDQALG